MSKPAAPKCLRCGRTVPPRRRATSDYCTDKCARDQQRDDEASAASERAAQETPFCMFCGLENPDAFHTHASDAVGGWVCHCGQPNYATADFCQLCGSHANA
jgi:hypothetical protein